MCRLDYIYESKASRFIYFKIPKELFSDSKYSGMSAEAKLLYGLCLDRASLSKENNWVDDQGRVYIFYSIEDVVKNLQCANGKEGVIAVVMEEEQVGGRKLPSGY